LKGGKVSDITVEANDLFVRKGEKGRDLARVNFISVDGSVPSSYELARQTAVDELDRLTEQKARLDKRVSKLKAAVQILDIMLEGNK
jgi:hypothetical protein